MNVLVYFKLIFLCGLEPILSNLIITRLTKLVNKEVTYYQLKLISYQFKVNYLTNFSTSTKVHSLSSYLLILKTSANLIIYQNITGQKDN